MVIEERLGSGTSKPVVCGGICRAGQHLGLRGSAEEGLLSMCMYVCERMLAIWGCYYCALVTKQRAPFGQFPNILPFVIRILLTM